MVLPTVVVGATVVGAEVVGAGVVGAAVVGAAVVGAAVVGAAVVGAGVVVAVTEDNRYISIMVLLSIHLIQHLYCHFNFCEINQTFLLTWSEAPWAHRIVVCSVIFHTTC